MADAIITTPPPADILKLRRRMERAVEKLLTALDTLDAPDDDLEDGGDEEPWLSQQGCGGHWNNQLDWAAGAADDREKGDDPREEDGSDEPELGATATVDQRRWGQPESPEFGWRVLDGEPLLSANENIDQRRWTTGDRNDLEEQCDDEGACADFEDGGDAEPDHQDELCAWPDGEVDQTELRMLPSGFTALPLT